MSAANSASASAPSLAAAPTTAARTRRARRRSIAQLRAIRNSHASTAYTVTLTSVADSKKRTGDITTYSLEAGDTMMFLVNNIEGWKQSDNYFYLTGSNASVLFAIIRLP